MEISKKKLAIVIAIAFLMLSCTVVSVYASIAAGWTATSVGTSQAYTYSVSMVLDSSGNPHVAYVDSSNNVDYASWTGTSWNIQIAATNALPSGSWVSLALDSNGNPYIAYETSSYSMACASYSSGSWSTQTVDSQGSNACSIAIGPNNYPSIAYYGEDNYGLMYASFSAGTWTTTQVDSGDAKGISLAFDSSGNPHIAYLNNYESSSYLKYASLSGSTWSTTDVTSASAYSDVASLAFSPTTHNPSISYYNYGSYDLMYVVYSGSSWGTPTTVYSAASTQVGIWNSLAFNAQGSPAIAYFSVPTSGTPGILQYTSWTGSAWSTPTTVDSAMNDGTGNESPVCLVFTPSGTPVIAYASALSSTNTIKVAEEASNFFVMPEYAYGALAGLVACFAAIAVLTIVKKRQHK